MSDCPGAAARSSRRAGQGKYAPAGYLHQRPRRCPDVGAGHESRCGRVSDKPVREQDLLDAIQLAIAKDRARRDEERIVARLRADLDTLTPREREVMAMVVAGRLNKQIAAELGLSERR